MRVLHFYYKTDNRAKQYIDVLVKSMHENVENKYCYSLRILHNEIKKWQPDIIHIHGCWHLSNAIAGWLAEKNNIRTIITPHGQLEPWILQQRHWTEKQPKLLVYQRRSLHKAYAIITMGRMEAHYLNQLGYNPNVEIILNSQITETINDEDMCNQVLTIYHKVLDTDVIKTMAPNTKIALKTIIKAGITGDPRWLNANENQACNHLNETEWHKIAVYACQEDINDVIGKGIATLKIQSQPTLYSTVNSYHKKGEKDKVQLPRYESIINDEFITKIIDTSRKYIKTKQLRIKHLIELASILRNSHINEDKVADSLYERKLTKYTSRLMHVLADTTGLEEGFMILPERNDISARKMETAISNHL